MIQEIFDQQLTLSLQRSEELWRQAEEFPIQQQKLLMERLEELSNSLEELQVAAEELRQQNKELAESHLAIETEHQRYQELFEFAPDGYLMTNKEGVILEVNRAAVELLNVSAERLINKPLVVFVETQDRRDFYSNLRQLQKGESIKNWQLQIQHRRGIYLKASLTVVPIQNLQGQVVALRWRLQDLTPSKNIESSQQQNEQLFCTMFENAVIGIALLDKQGGLIKSNRALQEMLGYSPEQLQAVFPELMNLDKTGVEAAMFQQLMAGQRRSYQLEKRFLCKDAPILWGRLTISRVQGADNEPQFVTCMLEDITEQQQLKIAQQQAIKQQQAIQQQQAIKQLEASLEKQKEASNQSAETPNQQLSTSLEELGDILNDILSSSPEFFFVYDQTGRFIYVNRAAAQALGFAQSDFINKTWRQLELPAETMERFDAQREAVLTTGQSLTDEAAFSTVDGLRDYEYTISPISDTNNEPKAVVVTVRDITEQKRAAVAASVALAKEEEFTVLKSHFSQFASVVAHELRNPLNNIYSCAKLIESNSPRENEDKRLNYLQRIQLNVRRINHLLNNLLLIKKLESGEVRLHPVLLDLTEFCRELTQELQQGVGSQHRLDFISQCQSSDVRMDQKLLRHILTNLLLNAIKYSPEGSEIKMEVICSGEQVIFSIQDSGIGIPQKDQDLLFKAFHRGSNVGSVAGSGLGLLIVKQFVGLQGGKISIESKEGLGTRSIVTLPLNRDKLGIESQE